MNMYYLKKSKNAFVPVILFLLLLIFTLNSCIKDNFELKKLAQTEWNPNIAVPLVYSSLSIQDLLTKNDKSGLIQIDSNHFCTLVYQGNLFSTMASDLVKLPDQVGAPYSASLDLTQIPILVANSSITVPFSQKVDFNTGSNSPKIDSMIFKYGRIEISMNSDFEYNGKIKVQIPAAKKNGVPFSEVLNLNYSGSVPVIVNTAIDLTNYHFDMTVGGTSSNQFVVNYELTLTGPGNKPTTANRVLFSYAFKNLQFDRIYGDLGQLPLSLEKDTVDISIFKNSLGAGMISLADPRLKMIFTNSYGVPIKASVSELDAYSPGAVPYQVTGCPNPLPIYSPGLNQIGQSLTGSFTLNNTNSNLVTIIKSIPKSFIYKIDSQTNPNGATHNNFILDSSRFKVDMEVLLPLWGTAKNFILLDTSDFKMEQQLTDQVESATIRTYNSNGFPIDIAMQVYFTDSTYKKLDSLILPYQLILKSAVVNPSTGKVIAPTEKTYDVLLTRERVSNLKTAKHILTKAVATTVSGGNTNIKIYSNYKIDVKLGVQAKLKKKL